MKQQNISIGKNSYYNKQILHEQNIKFINDSVIKRSKSKVGEIYFTKISEDLIINTFEEIRNKNHRFSVKMDGTYNLLEELLEMTIEKLTEYVVVHHIDNTSKKDYSIWNTVGIYTPDSYKSVNIKKQTINPGFDMESGNPRF